jgi:hypothetical protein
MTNAPPDDRVPRFATEHFGPACPMMAHFVTAEHAGSTGHHPEGAHQVELDVREDLRRGREPFSRILTAVSDLGADDVLHVRTIFEPVPLFAVLGRRGFAYESQSRAPDDWSAWFWHAGGC